VWERASDARDRRGKEVATQMGNQGTAGGNLRESVEIVQAA
jgi:hypothetical protein